MRVAMVGLCLLLFPTLVWAGTWRDDFENGDLDGWQKWEWPGQNTGKIEETNGLLTVADINAKFDTVAAFNKWIDRKLVQQVDWRKHRADLPEAGEIQIGVAGGESQWDNFVLSGDEVPDFSDLSVVPKGKLTTY